MNPRCSVGLTIEMVGGKWKGVILFYLLGGTLRFSELRKKIPAVTQRMLTLQLRELESDGLVERKVYPVVPPRVEYTLSPFGRSLEPVMRAMADWGKTNKDRVEHLIAERETISA
jgi:DNA-binding HxlR family transcriptional regulator